MSDPASIVGDRFFQSALTQVSDAVFVVNGEQRVVYLNPAAERQYAVTAGEVIGQPIGSLRENRWCDPGDAQRSRNALDRDGWWRGESIHRKRDGTEIHVESTVRCLRGSDGSRTGTLQVVRDITARNRAEAALADTEHRLRVALRGANLTLWAQDHELRYTWVCNLPHGWEPEQVIGKTDHDLVPAAELPRVVTIKQRVLETGQGESFLIWLNFGHELRCWAVTVEQARNRAGVVTGLTCAGIDVTERKRAERAIRESESRFRGTFENAAVGIAHVGLDGRWIRVNDMLCRTLGYARAELLGTTIQELTHPDDLAGDSENVRQLLEGEFATYTMELRYRRRDGAYVWANLTVSLLRDGAGEPLHFISVIEDITEKNRTLDELSRERSAFMRLAENSPDLIVRFDPVGRMRYINAETERVFGVPRPHLLGKTMAEVGAPADLCRVWQETLQRVVSGAGKSTVDLTFAHDGEPVHFSAVCVPEAGQDGSVETILSIARDVTELKRAIQHAREQQDRLNLAVTAANLGVFEWRLAAGIIHLANGVAREVLASGAGSAELPAARLIDEMLHPDDAPEFRARLAQAAGTMGTFSHACRLHRRDGSGDRWVEFIARCECGAAGAEPRLVGFVSDITERIDAATALARARDEAEATSRAKDRFLATLSHELRTPLAPALLIAAELEQSPQLPAELRRDCATVRSSIEVEARLIDDLLDVARIAQGKLQMLIAPCDAHAVLRRAAEMVQPDFDMKRISLEWRLEAAQAFVAGDSTRLQQVFWNLLRNAAKFTPPRGRVVLHTWLEGDAWRLEVRDNGIGIAAADLVRIFEAFVQTEQGGQARFGGLGLGLAISAFIVREHGGRIWAESAGLGQGSTFTLELPLGRAVAPALVGEPPQAAYSPRRLRILVVEDHAPTRLAFVALLRRRGHEAESAEGITEARALAASRGFDLVVSDLGLPDGSGLELMRALKHDHGLKGIALSGYGMEADIEAALDAGFLLHLTKPVTLGRLEEAVARISDSL